MMSGLLDSSCNESSPYGFTRVEAFVSSIRLVSSRSRFQPRMSLVTKAIALSVPDLAHFLLLFVVVIIGFASCGILLFGAGLQVCYRTIPSHPAGFYWIRRCGRHLPLHHVWIGLCVFGRISSLLQHLDLRSSPALLSTGVQRFSFGCSFSSA
jgi:hypothetical protein